MPHNTNITDVGMPYGGYQRVVEAGWNDNYLPIWMQEAGYASYYVGKLWNAHTPDNYNKPYAKGFNGSEFLLDPFAYRYWFPKLTRNGNPPVDYSGNYSTDLLTQKALGFLDDALETPDQPWMLTVAPNAPHSNGSNTADGVHWFGDPEYPDHYADLFKDYKIPRDKSFNTAIEGAVSWVKDLKPLGPKQVDYIDEYQRRRLRALQPVDEMIDKLISRLDKAGVLDNTYIVFSTDNGYHVGQHAMQPGKNCGYGEFSFTDCVACANRNRHGYKRPLGHSRTRHRRGCYRRRCHKSYRPCPDIPFYCWGLGTEGFGWKVRP